MEIDAAIATLTATENYRVLERLVMPETFQGDRPVDCKLGIYLDTETTGLSSCEDEIIELALVPFLFDTAANIIGTLDALSMFQEPAAGEISEKTTKLTGICFDDVRGHAIDWEVVRGQIAEAAVVVAHNAAFDRPFLETVEPMFELKAWACSLSDIDWRAFGFDSGKLEYLAMKNGFFFEGHRATIDCYAGLRLLAGELGGSGRTALNHMLDKARQRTNRIWAENAPFDFKNHLKRRGYRWSDGSDAQPRAWYIDVSDEALDEELGWLRADIYQSPEASPLITHFNAFSRYSHRI